jgi:DNA-binding transcriptional MerR regulator
MMNLELDMEWIDLIATAQIMGIPLEDVRHFLKESSNSETTDSKDSIA